LWREPFKTKRCIIPATSWFEYLPTRSVKISSLIKPVDAASAFAGLHREWRYKDDTIYSCALITTNHNPKFYHIHRKSFPVILHQESFDSWLDPKLWDTEHFESLFEPRLRTDFEVVGTDPKYNRPTNKNPKCIEPTGKPELIPVD